jgi:peptidoglycan/LPS O-acetylase OafA/YrhL
MPGLIFCVLIAAFIAGPLMSTLSAPDYFSDPLTVNYLKGAALNIQYALPGVFSENPVSAAVNGSIWSLPAEVVMYIVFPIAIFIGKKLRHYEFFITAATIAVCVIREIWLYHYPDFTPVVYGLSLKDVTTLAPYFFIGGMFTIPRYRALLNVQVAMMLIIFAEAVSLSGVKMDVLSFIALPYAVLSFAFAAKPVFAKFSVKNDYSYGIYLYGFPAQQAVIAYVQIKSGLTSNANIMFVMSFAIAFAFSIASWHLVEKPFQGVGRRIIASIKSC